MRYATTILQILGLAGVLVGGFALSTLGGAAHHPAALVLITGSLG